MENNRWVVTEKHEADYLPILKAFIEKVEDNKGMMEEVDLSDLHLNPYTLWQLLEQLGYEKIDIDNNGWEMDFWIRLKKKGYKPLTIVACGMTFELKLAESDDF